METNPRRYLFRMFIFLLGVSIIAALLAAPLQAAFMGNPALNGVILGAFGIGIIYIIRQDLLIFTILPLFDGKNLYYVDVRACLTIAIIRKKLP